MTKIYRNIKSRNNSSSCVGEKPNGLVHFKMIRKLLGNNLARTMIIILFYFNTIFL